MRLLPARLRAAFHRVRRAGRRVADVLPLTPLGLLVLVGSSAAWWLVGVGRHDHVVAVAAGVAAALVVLSVLAVSAGTLALALAARRARSEEPVVAEAEAPTWTSLTGLPRRLAPLLGFSWEWEAPEGFEVDAVPTGALLGERVTPTRRGLHRGVTRRFVVADSLGLARLAFRVREELEVRVSPSLGALRRAAIVSTLAGGDEVPHPWGSVEGDRLELRRHERTDPARLIVWKVFARTRKLVVRGPERAVARARSLSAYLVTSAYDEAAAGAARLAVESGALGTRWVLGADGVGHDAHRVDDALGVIAASGSRGVASEAEGLAAFLERCERQGLLRCLVFAPARGGAWVARVAGIARRRRGMLDVVLAGDGLRAPRPGLARRLLLAEPDDRAAREGLEATVRALAEAGARVAVVDRRTGRVEAPPGLWWAA